MTYAVCMGLTIANLPIFGCVFSGPRSGHQSPTLCITFSQGSAVEAMIYQMRGVSDVCRLSQGSAVETMIYQMHGVSEELM